MLDISPMMANRAMNVLAERDILVRRRRRGTFVGSGVRATEPNVAAVHMVGFMDDDPEWAPPLGRMLIGLRQSIPSARITTHHLPFRGALRHYREVVEQVARSDSFHGIILSYAPREVQEYTVEANLSAVVYGSPFPGVRLPCVETDQNQVGRLMAREAVSAGAKRLFVLARENWRHGDTLAFDGILAAAHELGLSPGDLRVRNFDLGSPLLERTLRAVIAEVAEEESLPTGLLCRSPQIARVAKNILSDLDPEPDLSHLALISTGTETLRPFHRGPAVRTVGCGRGVEDQFVALGRVLEDWKTVEGDAIPDSTLMGAVVLQS